MYCAGDYLSRNHLGQPSSCIRRLAEWWIFGIQPQGRKALEVILRYSVIGIEVMGVAYYIGINGTALVAVAVMAQNC